MGANRFFWPQELLDQWIVEEKITLEDNQLTLTEENRVFSVTQAVYFIADVGDGDDKYNLVGRVKEIARLEEMKAEHYMDSVIIDESAYQVSSGFTGEPEQMPDIAAQSGKNAASISEATSGLRDGEDAGDDRGLLAQFLIDNL